MIPRVCAVSIASLLLATFVVHPSRAQPPSAKPLPGGLYIEYREPTNPAHRTIYDRLRKRAVLEQYKEFMSPLRLKRPLMVTLQGCNGQVNAMYEGHLQKITYCYEYVAFQERMIADAKLLAGFRREDAIVGDFVSALLHETAHALFDLLDIPIFGREEDAADALASYVALQLERTRRGGSWRERHLPGGPRSLRGNETRASSRSTPTNTAPKPSASTTRCASRSAPTWSTRPIRSRTLWRCFHPIVVLTARENTIMRASRLRGSSSRTWIKRA